MGERVGEYTIFLHSSAMEAAKEMKFDTKIA